jgi:hypothetical protein
VKNDDDTSDFLSHPHRAINNASLSVKIQANHFGSIVTHNIWIRFMLMIVSSRHHSRLHAPFPSTAALTTLPDSRE